MAIFKDVFGTVRSLRRGKATASGSDQRSSLANAPVQLQHDHAVPVATQPVLPQEIWRTILAFTIRLNGRSSFHLGDPFLPPYATESSLEDEVGMREDRASVPLVCRSWASITSEILLDYLRIRSIPQLRAIVAKLESDNRSREEGPPFGDWVQRIDFHISEPLTGAPDLIPRLLRRTPNLAIYINKNGSDYLPETQTPSSVLQALAAYCGPSLRRIEWSHVGEAPAWCDLANLCQHTPNLRTIRLTWMFSYKKPFMNGPLDLPQLQTLSPRLLGYLSADSNMLPSLRRFEPTGAKIRLFRTTNWRSPPSLPSTLPLLPNLDSLVLVQSTEYVTLPPFHPTLRRICIVPFTEDYSTMVPPRFFNAAVLGPLEYVLLSIDSTKLCRLEEVRIRNISIFKHLLDEPAWLLKWAKRWRFKGVKFCDMHGQLFSQIVQASDDNPLLDTVRG
ncbi:hypothetical protein C8J57DRAFT_1323596 [Mycena rebaudengoi]|nr:hypothetical protein C8J57DRAFT_1323596 [Mycena rebaudengoi]